MTEQPRCKIRDEAKGGPCGEPAHAYFAASATFTLGQVEGVAGGVAFVLSGEARDQLEEQLSHIPVCQRHWEETGLAQAARYAAEHVRFEPTTQDRRL